VRFPTLAIGTVDRLQTDSGRGFTNLIHTAKRNPDHLSPEPELAPKYSAGRELARFPARL
jgi:hypothetical protein